jgi:hypothetical protein
MIRIRLFVSIFVIAVCILSAGMPVAPSGFAESSDDPCELALNFFCRLLPIAPDLDHDIDLTTPSPATDVPDQTDDPQHTMGSVSEEAPPR